MDDVTDKTWTNAKTLSLKPFFLVHSKHANSYNSNLDE